MSTIDMHTHMVSDSWLEVIRTRGGAGYGVEPGPTGNPVVLENGVPMRTNPSMFDYKLRIANMDKNGIDISVVSLTSPGVSWGDAEASADAARAINDSMAAAQKAYPDRIRFLASLPWEYPDRAIAEIDRARKLGAVGLVTLCNLRGKPLIDPQFAPVWAEVNRLGLPVFVHPTNPPGFEAMGIEALRGPLGFTFDTALAFAKMIISGFLDTYPNIKFIAAHAGGMLPYHAGRLDLFQAQLPAEKRLMKAMPSDYLRRLYYDATTYQMDALQMLVGFAGADRILFGTDWPHATDVPGILGRIDQLWPEERAKIRGGNAEALFKL